MDIALCFNSTCPLRDSCFRFTATPSEWQSFVHFTPDEKTRRCEMYWEVKGVGETKEESEK